MNEKYLKKKLELIIESKLLSLIDSDYVLWDLPYHINMGDILIWEGELDFLKKTPYKMLNYGSAYTVKFPKLDSKTVILLHGGGNFGDIYRSSQDFRNKVVELYPNNKIIIFPQTVYYNDLDVFDRDMEILAKHKSLIVCVRDEYSYKLLADRLVRNNVYLLPDMAFCINSDKIIANSKDKILYMKRIDCEANDNIVVDFNYDKISDWPSFEFNTPLTKKLKNKVIFQIILNKLKARMGVSFFPAHANKLDIFMNNVMRPYLFSEALKFINEYELIYTTRLHGCILAVLTGKKVKLLDNSYGKNSKFYKAWLSDYDKIECLSKESKNVS